MIKYNPDIHHRRSIRLKGYDYSQTGLYFITICVQDRLRLFGNILNGTMKLDNTGEMIQNIWNEIPQFYEGINIAEFQIMPNHIHGIIQIKPASELGQPSELGKPSGLGQPQGVVRQSGQPQGVVRQSGQPQGVAPTGLSLPDVVCRFKTLTTKKYIDGVKQNNWPLFNRRLWQHNYYEHIIRNEISYHEIAEYIVNNPLKWQDDKYYA